MNKTLVILNPAARGERARSLREKIETLSLRAVVRMTSSIGDAREMAADGVADGFETIVAAGGDGTVNEVANGLAGSPAQFGILPVGTMNVFATELGIPTGNLEAAWSIIDAGHTRKVDFPTVNGIHFVQLAGAGLDAEVVRRTSPDSKKSLGPISYLLTLAQVAADRPPAIRIQPDDSHERAGSFILVGNGRFYGGPFVLFKDARPDDGLLDVLVFKNQSHWDVVRYIQAIAFGNHPALPDVDYFQTRAMTLESDGETPVELDGEPASSLPARFEIPPTRLTVLAPT
ncbi:MAG: diacylglycerol kinase family lipid kinase [Terrimicrobiaceae bacterium]|nr:diacylglycerol kinase family lipid kinase [Terrimicrobiaceae bacterium]